jgi:hypothetical protein
LEGDGVADGRTAVPENTERVGFENRGKDNMYGQNNINPLKTERICFI